MLSGTSSAYYYYYFAGAPAHYDLSALANNTIPFYISNQGPAALTSGDSYQAVVSEIRAAADSVELPHRNQSAEGGGGFKGITVFKRVLDEVRGFQAEQFETA